MKIEQNRGCARIIFSAGEPGPQPLSESEQDILYTSLLSKLAEHGSISSFDLLCLLFLRAALGNDKLTRKIVNGLRELNQALKRANDHPQLIEFLDASISRLGAGQLSPPLYRRDATIEIWLPQSQARPTVTTPPLACESAASEIRHRLDIHIDTDSSAVVEALNNRHVSDAAQLDLCIEAHQHSFRAKRLDEALFEEDFGV